jgi:prepilin-type N-terminal cleavage/methylation domain-containing protein
MRVSGIPEPMNSELKTMNSELRHKGFSLTEVLIAVGILAVGLMFIAGTFPVGIGLTTIAAERTIGAIAADEAFTKIRLYGVNVGALSTEGMTDFNDVPGTLLPADTDRMFAYPSVDTGSSHSYYWSALCRRIDEDSRLVQVNVFVCRKTGMQSRYPIDHPDDDENAYDWPRPVLVEKIRIRLDNKKVLRVSPRELEKRRFFVAGSTIVADPSGGIYRVVSAQLRDPVIEFKIDRDVQLRDMTDPRGLTNFWVVPPAVGGGRNPTIGVYQRVIKF